jgi:hypothetical protein
MRSRYRTENGEPILDVRAASIDRLFDNRDPAPFRDRDLDPDLVEYLLDGARDLASAGRLQIAFWLGETRAASEIDRAVRAHFQHELDRSDRRRREQVRSGWIALAIAALAVTALMALGELVERSIAGTLGTGLKEALVISGWVLMWRPVEVLAYDAIPWKRERRVLRAILDASIDVRRAE